MKGRMPNSRLQWVIYGLFLAMATFYGVSTIERTAPSVRATTGVVVLILVWIHALWEFVQWVRSEAEQRRNRSP